MELLKPVLIALSFVLAAVAGVLFGWYWNKKITEAKLQDAEDLSHKIVEEARKESETLKKEAILEAKDEWYERKVELEREIQTLRNELKEREKRLATKETHLDRKVDVLNKKEKAIAARERELQTKGRIVDEKDQRLSELITEQSRLLERISHMTSEEAKQMLIRNMEDQARMEAAQKIREIKDRAMREAEREAKHIISMAIERYAAEHVAESTVAVVSLPNDDMKGRIIGREGRNIRAFENLTGIDVIIDDTPEAVLLSGFDPIRREVARTAMEKLVSDGRIHPARIEDIVRKAQFTLEEDIAQYGEETCLELGLNNVHPEMQKLIGKLKYRTSYGQNMLQHSKEVAILAGLMAAELGLNAKLCRRSGLLHDIGKVLTHENEGSHIQLGVEVAKKYGEPQQVINVIAEHHEDTEVTSMMTVLVSAADTISSARPGARRETLEAYIKRLEKLEEIAGSFEGVGKSYAIQAGREIRIMVKPSKVNDTDSVTLSEEIAREIEKQVDFPGNIKVTVIRETRAVAYAS